MPTPRSPKTPEADPSPDSTPQSAPLELEPDLTYEQARDELIAVVNRLESGGASLDESMELFKRGQALASLCERFLDAARATVESAKGD